MSPRNHRRSLWASAVSTYYPLLRWNLLMKYDALSVGRAPVRSLARPLYQALVRMKVIRAGKRIDSLAGREVKQHSFIIAAVILAIGAICWVLPNSNNTASNNTAKRRAVAVRDQCEPSAVEPSKQATDRYDHWVMSLGPVLYLPLGATALSTESSMSGNGFHGVFVPSSRRPEFASLPN
jgi:hypothetical protein